MSFILRKKIWEIRRLAKELADQADQMETLLLTNLKAFEITHDEKGHEFEIVEDDLPEIPVEMIADPPPRLPVTLINDQTFKDDILAAIERVLHG